MPKIVIARIPGFHTDFRPKRPIPNVGVGFIASIAKEEGFDPVVLEGHYWMDSGYLNYRLNYWERINFFVKEIEPEHPDILGLSVLSGDLALGIEFAKAFKKKYPQIPIIMGGPGVNGVEKTIARYEDNSIDILVRGEGEESFREVLKEYKKGSKGDYSRILGISYREGNKWYHNLKRPLIENLDSLPFTSLEYHKNLTNNISTLLPVERGCHGNCKFCFVTNTWGRGRYFSCERIKKQAEILASFQKENKKFLLSDSNIFNNEEKGVETVSFILKNFPRTITSINLRVDQTKPEILSLFRDFPYVNPLLGVESLTPSLLTFLGKTKEPQEYIKQAYRVFDYFIENRIRFNYSLIYHIPGETKEDLKKLYDFLLRCKTDRCSLIYLSALWLEGNTAIWDEYEKGNVNIFNLYKPMASSLGEQYTDPIFEPFAYRVRNPLLSEREYAEFIRATNLIFAGTECNFRGG